MTGINNIDEIINVSDGIMVARGDLGVEVPMTKLPIMQKMMARKCRENGKICVVATEMLESMKTGLRPTRAEVSDVANAVLDGTDAVMLSGETTMGKSPIATVNFMASICRDTEDYYDKKFDYTEKIGVTESIADAVCNIESVMNIKAIIAPTVSGYSAKKISNLKPKCPILATCTTAEVANKLALNYGVITKIVPVFNNTDDVLNNATEEAKKAFELQSNDKIIITGSLPLTSEKRVTNFMKIEEI
jgi:pyruvate kinase